MDMDIDTERAPPHRAPRIIIVISFAVREKAKTNTHNHELTKAALV
jgi:hypothetical protein